MRELSLSYRPPPRARQLPKPTIPTATGRLVNSCRNLANGLAGVCPQGVLPALHRFFKEPLVRGPGGAFAVLGGLLQSRKGLRELRQGDRVNGLANLGTGAANVAGGLALALASPVVSIAFGAASLADGTRDVINGMQQGNRGRVIAGALKNTGGTLLVAGGVLACASVGLVPGAFMAASGGLLSLGVTIADSRLCHRA